MITLPVTPIDRRIAQYAAMAIALTVAEAALPTPLPGVKPGLANITVLLVLIRHGWRDAVWVSLLRVMAASLLLGQFLTPGFFLALVGAFVSLGVLYGLYEMFRWPASWFGPISASILAALAHVGAQVMLARIWFVPHDGLFYLLPVLGTGALVFGIINGLIVAHVLARWPESTTPKPPC